MKKIQLLILTLLIPFLGFTQNDSWVRFQVQFDFYAPAESNFFMVSDSTLDSTFYYQPTQSYEYLDTIINLVSGDYTISLTDNYGDGWVSQFPASFKMGNTCQGDIINWDPVLGSFFLRDTTVNILPCAPPSTGCTDPNALNFDPTATLDDGSCTYPPCGGFLNSSATQICLPNGQALINFNWEVDTTNINCEIVRFWYSNANGVGPFQYGLGPNATNFEVYAGNGQMPPQWSVEHYGTVEFADGSVSDTIFFTPVSCIEGCTDPTQPTYNPWATIDDGSCSGTTCDYTEYQVTMEITFDNWPNETSWELYSGGVVIDSAILGTYSFNDVGQTYTYTFCTNQTLGFELVVADSYGDGMAGSTSGGSMDGMIVIYDCNGDTIWHMDNPGFGDTLLSGTQFGVACNTYADIFGCTDDDYQEYDPTATIDDGSCVNLHIYGCTDTSAFNYDPTATILDLVPDCQYQLHLYDAGGDGWGNSYIGVYQNGINFGTYQIPPGIYQDSFTLVLDAGIPVQVYYFEVGGPQQPPEEVQFQTWHNSFKLTNANDVVLMYEGQNPFANNGQGALQSFAPPFWTIYSAIPYCGDYCIEGVLGCMDPLSFNYDSLANMDDGSCIPFILGCTNNLAFNYDSLANLDDGSCIPISYGCTDTIADNYNSLANTDDGSCYYIGCTDTTALNYDPTATVNNGCVYPIYGCTDPTAFNYDATANVDDGSCLPIIFGCMDATSFNYNPLANTDNGSCIPVVFGCIDPTQFNYDPTANTDNGSCIQFIYGCTDSTAINYDPVANTDNGSCIPVLLGCTDSIALNYNALANTDDGSCIMPIYGCTDANAFNYDPTANTDDGSCIAFVYGCMDATQFNYNPLANADNGSCIPFVYGCTDPTQFNYNFNANTDNGSCISYIYGCTDSTAFNYNINANTDNGSCVSIINGCTDSTAINYDPLANIDDGSCIAELLGCTDSTAINYNILANTDDGSCIATVLGCTDPLAFNYSILANVDDGSCIPVVLGCTDPTQFNYNLNANTDDGSCMPYIYGCMDATAFNYDPLANTDNGSCIAVIFGCTNSTALNYNILANTDNGTCILPITGCTDVSAANYDPLANTSDSTACLYDAGCYQGEGLPYWLNDGCFAWVIDVDNYCCTNDWDASCQSMYDYCQQGWPTSIEDVSSLGIVVYPNPTKNIITIETRLEVEIEVYDMMGRLLIEEKNTKRLDLSDLSNGLYNLSIIYNNKRYSKQIIKQ